MATDTAAAAKQGRELSPIEIELRDLEAWHRKELNRPGPVDVQSLEAEYLKKREQICAKHGHRITWRERPNTMPFRSDTPLAEYVSILSRDYKEAVVLAGTKREQWRGFDDVFFGMARDHLRLAHDRLRIEGHSGLPATPKAYDDPRAVADAIADLLDWLRANVDADAVPMVSDAAGESKIVGRQWTPATGSTHCFCESNGKYQLRFGDESGELRKLKGASYIRAALANPGAGLDCKAMEEKFGGKAREARPLPSADLVENVESGFTITGANRDVELDDEGKEFLRDKMQELADLRDDAKECCNAVKANKYEAARAEIEQRLRNAEYQGRDKTIEKTPEEKSRQAVRKAIKDAIKAIRTDPDPMPALADFLTDRINTGGEIVYLPPDPPVDWAL